MRKDTAKKTEGNVQDYRHDAKRKNNPPVGMVSYEPMVREARKQSYAYDPHLSPQLVWAGKAGLKQFEVEEKPAFETDTVSLHIHERVSTSAIVRAVQRPEPKQFSLFNDPEFPLSEAVEFYGHDMNWTNRLILGDSLLVMNSLLQKELMAGKVQMIYLDPPYGIRYASNFQPRVDQRDVKDDDAHLTREPEQIKAYRDTWTLGVHSYLTYLRDRLILCRELLTESGSIFVQIGDENLHRVRCLMDEVLGGGNFVLTVVVKKKGATTPTDPVNDYLVWFAKDKTQLKTRRQFQKRNEPEEDARFNTLIRDEHYIRVGDDEDRNSQLVSDGYQWARVNYPVVSQDPSPRSRDFVWRGRTYSCGENRHWTFDPEADMGRLASAGRLFDGGGKSLGGVVKWDDWPCVAMSNLWDDLHGEQEVVYVVQTNRRVIARCLLMTTDPGDLVLDPTCGSGTTAYVAEQWGRRWITMDTSRVALSLARQRIMTATFPYYALADKSQGITGGFVYTTVPHIT